MEMHSPRICNSSHMVQPGGLCIWTCMQRLAKPSAHLWPDPLEGLPLRHGGKPTSFSRDCRQVAARANRSQPTGTRWLDELLPTKHLTL